jgi:putative ABC transport system permease protein
VRVGDTITVTANTGSRDFEVVGVATFAGNETSGGATWALFDLDTAMEFVVGSPGLVDAVMVVGDGSVSQEELATRVNAAVGTDDIEAITGKEIIEENQSAIQEGLGFFTTFLTIFAGIATFVGCFVIYNVFKISAAQRLRENALMRAIGATSKQVVRVQLIEAVCVGLLGGLLGFAAGIGLAALILGLLSAAGFAPSDAPLTILPSSFVTTMFIGLVVTMVCAVLPAVRAGRTPPLAAMRDVSVDRSARSKRRLVVGACALAVAALGIVLGLGGRTIWLAPGVVGMLVAAIAFGPAIVGPLSAALVKPLRSVRGVNGEMAARNASRSPERTALTAATLGIGLTLMVGVSTLGASMIQSFRNTIAEQFNGDISIATSSQDGLNGLPPALLDEVLALPEIDEAVSFGGAPMRLSRDGDLADSFVGVVNVDGADALIDVPFVEGSWDDVSGTAIGVSKDRAKNDGLTVGSTIDGEFLNGDTVRLTVAAIYDSDFLGAYGADRSLFDGTDSLRFDFQILATGADGVSESALRDAVTAVTDQYPSAETKTRDQFIDDQLDQFRGFLNFIYALLGMSIFIAVIGIVLTLLLSIYERRRELGLVRAVGMTRPQVRSSVRWESIVTAVLGAALGVGLGISLGWIVVKALEDEGLNTFAVAPVSLTVFVVMAIVLALIAAWLPARRAANANILEAIATT